MASLSRARSLRNFGVRTFVKRWIHVLVVMTFPWVKWTIIRISEFENDYEFVCLVILRMRSCP